MITALDLVQLRDIGDPSDRLDLESPLALSPDGTRLAFLLRRADTAGNRICQGLILLDLSGRKPPEQIDAGGDLIRAGTRLAGLELPEGGTPAIITPRWSPDGSRLAYPARFDGHYVVRLLDLAAHGVRHRDISVERAIETLAWSRDGRHLIVGLAADRRNDLADREQEARRGYLFDDRFRPIAGSQPFLRVQTSGTPQLWEISGDAATLVTQEEAARAEHGSAPDQSFFPLPTGPHVRSGRSNATGVVWAEQNPAEPGQSLRLVIRRNGGTTICTEAACRGRIIDLWLQLDGKGVLILRREAPGSARSALYRWRPGASPEAILRTGGLLIGCLADGQGLICLEEQADRPRRVVRVDGTNGRITLLFDPNPEWRSLEIGSVRRLRWVDRTGRRNDGDLLLPPGHRAGDRHPLLVVQYRARGFLRGGTGDEFPVQLFAARGFAVLSFNYPTEEGEGEERLPPLEDDRDPLVWRRAVQTSLEAAVESAIATGTVDARRMGITGLSDGATTAYWALINSNLFQAASLGSCCMDEAAPLVVGPAYVSGLAENGYPPQDRPNPAFWRASSLAANADRIGAPILMQLSDDEYLHALPSWFALKARSRPVEMYVFPGERHIKWQPAHRLAIYERNVDWFDFWLNAHPTVPVAKAEQFARWSQLKADQPIPAR